MTRNDTPNEGIITSYAQAPARTITAGSVTYAYRELGPKAGIPVIFFVHLAATLDNWDPRIIGPIAKNHHVIAFDNRGVGASTGQVPDTVEAMADDAYTFIKSLGFSKIDIFSFSLGGFVAQALVLKHPDLVPQAGAVEDVFCDAVLGIGDEDVYLSVIELLRLYLPPGSFLHHHAEVARSFLPRHDVHRPYETRADHQGDVGSRADVS
jgi:pimeloyl-ACP methyl ester carboxylesterase